MLKKFKAVRNGLHYKILGLVTGLLILFLSIQLGIDTFKQLNNSRNERLNEALGVTNVIARSLEKQFDIIELDDIEQILASVRKRSDISKLSVVDKHVTFFLDGDLITSPIAAVNHSKVQMDALKTAKTVFDISGKEIEVGEPLLANGQAIGSVMVSFKLPTFVETIWPIIKSKLATLLPIIAVGTILAASLVRQITLPLRVLSNRVKAISTGNLEGELEPQGAEEIKQLGSSFNQMVSTLRDNISQIYELAYVDKVTRLPNREYFRKELQEAIAISMRTETSGALLFLDLDGFKRVNDTFGHDFGDRLLELFGERIGKYIRTIDSEGAAQSEEQAAENQNAAKNARRHDVLARLGGDEFTILLSEIREETDAAIVARRIIESISEPFSIEGKEITIGASIGIATFPRDGADFQTIMKHADMAMYQAKDEGKNTVRFFSEELNQKTKDRMEIEIDLRKAIENKELELFYQPKVDVLKQKVNAVEALIRWHHPKKGMINPNDFISIAEDTGLILPLGLFVIETACEQIVALSKQGRDISIAVNISMNQFEKPDFAETILNLVEKTGADPKLLELEITESMAMNNYEIALDHIAKLKKVGIRFAIDDFGTGYSNLAQLSRLPFDVFKIDRSFVDAMTSDQGNDCNVIVKTIAAMAHSLNFETVAEGVETEEQLVELLRVGCSVMQGYYFAKPMAIGNLVDWLDEAASQQIKDAGKLIPNETLENQKAAA